MIAWLLVGMAVPWLAASALVRRCDAGAGNDAATAWLHAVLALGLALGLSSCSYFRRLLSCGSAGLGRGYCIIEILGFAGLGLVCRLAPRQVGWSREVLGDGALRDPVRENAERIDPRNPIVPRWIASRTLQVVFVVALISAISGIAGMFAVEPHGDWDAWNIWTMRARFLFRSGQQWRNAFGRSSSTPITLCC